MRLQDVTLRDFRTVDAANILSDLYRSNRHGRTMLKHCKSIPGGISPWPRIKAYSTKPTKDVPENTVQAMNRLEQLFNECSTTKQQEACK